MTTASGSTRNSRLVRRSVTAVSRRGLQFVRRASIGGLVAASVFAADQATVRAADIILPPNLTIGSRTIEATNALRGAYYDPNANPPQGSFDSVAGIRALEQTYITAGFPNTQIDLTQNLDFDQGGGNNPPFFPLATNDTLASVWSGEIVVDPSAAGLYRFDAASDDGTVGFIDGNYIVQNNFYQGRTQRNFNVNLTAGVHPIVMAWYEGGSGANGTFWLYPDGTAARIVNPASPPTGITFRKVSYTTDTSKNGMNVIVNADAKIDVQQETAVPFGTLTLANAVTLTVDSLTDVSFTKTTMGSTGTLAVNSGKVVTGAITSGGAITTLRKTGGGTVEAVDTSVASGFTAASTLEVAGGTFVGRSRTGAGAITARPSSIGDAKLDLTGGTFVGRASNAYEVPGTAGRVGVTFFNGASNEQQIGPIGGVGGIDVAPLGLLTRNDGKTLDYAGDLRFDDDNPDIGAPNFNTVSGNFVGVDNLQVLGLGIATFTTSPDFQLGDSYTIGTTSDDGVTMWIDLDNDGKFESPDNGGGKDELVHNDNTFHGPQVRLSNVTIPAGTYRFATGFYEGGGNAQMDFRIARGAETAADYAELKAKFAPIGPADTSIITGMKSILLQSNSDYTLNPVTVAGDSGLRGEGAVAKYGDVRLNNGSSLTVGGPMTINNTTVDGSATMKFLNAVDFGKLGPATPGAAFTFIKGGPADIDLGATTAYNTFDNKATIGVSGGRLLVNGAQSSPASPTSIGSANILLAGGTFLARGTFNITDTAGAANQLTEYFYQNGGDQPTLIDPIFAATGLFAKTPVRTLALTGPISGINDAVAQARWGAQDNLEAMWYGDMTFTTSGVTGNTYTFGSNTDDGSVWWIDLNNDGKFSKADGELVMSNNFYQGPTIRANVVDVSPGTHRVALAAYEGGGGMLFEFKFGRGTITDWNDVNAQFVDPTVTSIATYRAHTYGVADVFTPSFAGNVVTVTGNTTVDSAGASAFGPTTFQNTAEVNFINNASSLASATVNSGTGTIRNSSGANRITVGDVGAASGATLAFSGSDSKVTGAITGAGTVRLNEGTLEFTKNGAAATGTPALAIQQSANLGSVATMKFNPGTGNTFAASAVRAISNEGLLHAASGTVDLSGANITTTYVRPAQRAGLLEVTLNGGFNLGPITAPADFNTATYTLELASANIRDTDAARVYPTDSTQVYTGEIFIPDTDGNGRAGPIAFGEHFDDGVLLKINGQTLLNDGAWNVQTDSGAFELPAGNPAGFYSFEARLGRGGGPNGQQAPWDVFGIGMDTNNADGFLPAAATYRGDNGENDFIIDNNEASYVKPVDSGSGNLFRFSAPLYGEVRVDPNVVLKVGSIVGANAVNIAANARLQLNGTTTSKIVSSALSIAGTPAAPTATLDVGNSAIVLDYPAAGPNPAADVRQRLIVGRGGTGLGKPWNGKGITSSQAQADVAASPNSRSVGYAVNADLPLGALTTFRGQPVDPSSVLIRYTRTADANLDGVVNDDDVTVVGTFYAPGVPKPEWAKGDFDFNGFVDDDDVTLLGVFYNPSAPPIPAPDGGGAVAAVPEPASWLMLTLGGLGAGLFGWRKRKAAAK